MLIARLRLTDILTESGKANNALVILDQAPEGQKHTAQFVFEYNRALMADNRWDDAAKSVRAAIAQFKGAGFFYQDAVIRVRAHDIPGARKSLDQAFALAPAEPRTVNLLGEVMRQQEDYPAFVARLKEAAAKNPSSAFLQHAVATALERQGDTEGARTAFAAAEKSGDVVSSEIELASIDARAGRVDQARQRLLTLSKDHDNARIRLILGELDLGRNAVDAALADYLAAIKLEPANALAMNNMAAVLATRQKKYDDALFWGQKALALAPNNPAVEDTIGWTYYLAGRYDQAMPWLEKSQKTLDRPLAHYHLAANLLKAGDKSRANQEYQLALKGDPKSPERTQIDPLFLSR
jgi:tetratricopeptide (TPR) repeat protein